MSRITPSQNPNPKSQELLNGVKQMLGGTPSLFTTLAHSSSALGFVVAGFSGFKDSNLSGALREQIALTVSGANRCDYCASAHTALGQMHKVELDELRKNVVGHSDNAKTQAALTFAARVVELRGHVTNEDLAAVRAAGYTDADILDIIAVSTLTILTNYVNNVAATEIDFPHVSTAELTASAA